MHLTRHSSRQAGWAAALATLLCAGGVRAADDDALDLQAEPAPAAAAPAASGGGGLKLSLEAAAANARRAGGGTESGRRFSVDLRYDRSLSPGWRAQLSDRFDDIHPVLPGQRSTRNQLREAALSWQSDDGTHSVDLGRLNVRHGAAYGYNPTDVFRDGATRTVVSADPIAIRQNRLGTYMVRATRLWQGGGASLVFAPKLTDQPPSDSALSLDTGATNGRQRWLASVNHNLSDKLSGELLALVDRDGGNKLGANFSGVLGDAWVGHGEWMAARTLPLLLTGDPAADATRHWRQQGSLGVTFTPSGGLSLTAEWEFNGAGLDRDGVGRLFQQSPERLAGFFGAMQASQELAPRNAWLLYASQKGVAGVKQLDLSAFIRQNATDHSRLGWLEARYHLGRMDLALQWQQAWGDDATEYGATPYRRVVQLLGTLYF